MVFVPRTYARAAGIQSEIGKTTVNKIANLENDYRRVLHFANKEMKKTLGKINHYKEVYQKSYRSYRKQIWQYKQKERQKVLPIIESGAHLPIVVSELPENRLVLPLIEGHDKLTLQQNADESDSKTRKPQNNIEDEGSNKLEVASSKLVTKLPSLSGGEYVGKKGSSNGIGAQEIDDEIGSIQKERPTYDQEQKNQNTQSQHESKTLLDKLSATQNRASVDTPVENSKTSEKANGDATHSTYRPTRKRRSGAVNLVNIMRLQYSSNLKALFRTVDVLAKVHGVTGGSLTERRLSGPMRHSQGVGKNDRTFLPRETEIPEYQRLNRVANSRSQEIRSQLFSDNPELNPLDSRRLSQASKSIRVSENSGGRKLSQASKSMRLSQDSNRSRSSQGSQPVSSDSRKHSIESQSSTTAANEQLSLPFHSKVSESTCGTDAKRAADETRKDQRKLSTNTTSSVLSDHSSFNRYRKTSGIKALHHKTAEPSNWNRRYSGDSDHENQFNEHFFDKVCVPENDVEWKTALGIIKHVHFIDTTNLS